MTLTVQLLNTENIEIHETSRYGLHVFSQNQQEASQQLNEEFAFLYDDLIHEPNDNLTHNTIELRSLFNQM